MFAGYKIMGSLSSYTQFSVGSRVLNVLNVLLAFCLCLEVYIPHVMYWKNWKCRWYRSNLTMNYVLLRLYRLNVSHLCGTSKRLVNITIWIYWNHYKSQWLLPSVQCRIPFTTPPYWIRDVTLSSLNLDVVVRPLCCRWYSWNAHLTFLTEIVFVKLKLQNIGLYSKKIGQCHNWNTLNHYKSQGLFSSQIVYDLIHHPFIINSGCSRGIVCSGGNGSVNEQVCHEFSISLSANISRENFWEVK